MIIELRCPKCKKLLCKMTRYIEFVQNKECDYGIDHTKFDIEIYCKGCRSHIWFKLVKDERIKNE